MLLYSNVLNTGCHIPNENKCKNIVFVVLICEFNSELKAGIYTLSPWYLFLDIYALPSDPLWFVPDDPIDVVFHFRPAVARQQSAPTLVFRCVDVASYIALYCHFN